MRPENSKYSYLEEMVRDFYVDDLEKQPNPYQNEYLVSTVLFVPRSGLSHHTVRTVLRRSLISPSKDNRSRPTLPYSVLLLFQ